MILIISLKSSLRKLLNPQNTPIFLRGVRFWIKYTIGLPKTDSFLPHVLRNTITVMGKSKVGGIATCVFFYGISIYNIVLGRRRSLVMEIILDFRGQGFNFFFILANDNSVILGTKFSNFGRPPTTLPRLHYAQMLFAPLRPLFFPLREL